jgi:replicative DNA helicase
MEIDDIVKKISEEKAKAETEIQSDEGLMRLQEVAAQYDGEYRLIWSDEVLENIKNKPQATVFPTNIPELDELITGFREQQLITVSAHSKHGKTTFGTYLLHALEAQNPLLIGLEQSNEEIIEQRHENGQVVPKFLSPLTLPPRTDVDWIEQRIIEGIAKYNTKVVVIDHLGYIDNNGPNGQHRRENLAYRVGEVMRALKNIAKRWRVVIVLMVHISQGDEGKPPTLEDIKNSSDILQESDMVMMLWRKNHKVKKIRVYEDKTMVSVLANRRTGRNGNVGMKFNSETGLYESDNAWVQYLEEMAQATPDDDDDF